MKIQAKVTETRIEEIEVQFPVYYHYFTGDFSDRWGRILANGSDITISISESPHDGSRRFEIEVDAIRLDPVTDYSRAVLLGEKNRSTREKFHAALDQIAEQVDLARVTEPE